MENQEQEIKRLKGIIKQALEFIGENSSLNDAELDELVEILDAYR